MTIQSGDKIPSVTLKRFADNKLQNMDTCDVFNDKNVVMFGVVGAFTPTCSDDHLPGYVDKLDEFKALGIDIVCLSVNDPFVMGAWSKFRNAEGITMLADGNTAFTKALGLEMDGTKFGLGQRCQRFALYAEDGMIKALAVEKPGVFDVSSAEAMLKTVGELKTAA